MNQKNIELCYYYFIYPYNVLEKIVNEFLMSIGYLKGAHSEDCLIHKKIITLSPMWSKG